MQGYEIDFLAVHIYLLDSGSVRNRFALLIRVSDLQNGSDRILGSDFLRIVVTVSTESRIVVTILLGKFRPSVREISVFVSSLLICIISINRSSLTPYAYVRVIFLHPLDKVFILVRLVCPHTILNIPVEDPQCSFLHRLAKVNDFDGIHEESVIS